MLPRVCGAVVSMFALIIVFDVVGVLGGFGVSVLLMDIPFVLLKGKFLSALSNTDLGLSAFRPS